MNILQKKASRPDKLWEEVDLALCHKVLFGAKPETGRGETGFLDKHEPLLKGHGIPEPGKHAEAVHTNNFSALL